MKKILINIFLLSLSSVCHGELKCGNEGEEKSLIKDNSIMSKIPVGQQGQSGTCYAYSATQLYDFLYLTENKNSISASNKYSSPIAAAIEGSQRKYTQMYDEYEDTTDVLSILEGGNFCDTLTNLVENGSCPQKTLMFDNQLDGNKTKKTIESYMEYYNQANKYRLEEESLVDQTHFKQAEALKLQLIKQGNLYTAEENKKQRIIQALRKVREQLKKAETIAKTLPYKIKKLEKENKVQEVAKAKKKYEEILKIKNKLILAESKDTKLLEKSNADTKKIIEKVRVIESGKSYLRSLRKADQNKEKSIERNHDCQNKMPENNLKNILTLASDVNEVLDQVTGFDYIKKIITKRCGSNDRLRLKKAQNFSCRAIEISRKNNSTLLTAIGQKHLDEDSAMETINNFFNSPNQPIPITIDARLFTSSRNALRSDSFSTNTENFHSVLLVGRRNQGGKCQFQIRNSWGKDCKKGYDQSFQNQNNCKDGNVWVDGDDLKKTLIQLITY